MTDEAGGDGKVLAVPHETLTRYYTRLHSFQDLPEDMLDKITHFFAHYKDLEKDKWVKVDGWYGPKEAMEEIASGVKRFNAAIVKPEF